MNGNIKFFNICFTVFNFHNKKQNGDVVNHSTIAEVKVTSKAGFKPLASNLIKIKKGLLVDSVR